MRANRREARRLAWAGIAVASVFLVACTDGAGAASEVSATDAGPPARDIAVSGRIAVDIPVAVAVDLPDLDSEDLLGMDADEILDAAADADLDADAEAAPDVEPDFGPAPAAVVVLNELRCTDRDWIELFNAGVAAVDLGGWSLTDREGPEPDAQHTYTFAPATLVPAGGFVVVRRQTPDEAGMTFGIACASDRVRLVDAAGVEVDAVEPPEIPAAAAWGLLPDGVGAWTQVHPTPGAPNQAPTDPSEVFFGDAMVTIDLGLDEAARAQLDVEPSEYVRGTFRATFPDGASDLITVGVRLKGRYGSFRELGDKAAFKVKFDGDVAQDGGGGAPGGRFLGLKKLTLNNMVQDPSVIHEAAAYHIFRSFGVPAPRLGYAWVVVDGVPYGLYANIETYDDVMLDQRFPGTTHLYEGAYGQDVQSGEAAELEVDEGSADDIGDLEALIEAVYTVGEGWMAAMGAVADLDELTRMWAVEVFVGHWDGYAPTVNNYFLHSDGDQVFRMFPWGTDQTFSSHIGFAEGQGLLFRRCLEQPDCLTLYVQAVDALVTLLEGLDVEGFIGALNQWLAPWVLEDPRVSPDGQASAVQATLDFLASRLPEARSWVSCLVDPDPDPDGDGFGCLDDCDTADPAVHPGAEDICGDGIDQDCSGAADDGVGCPDCDELWRGGHRYLVCLHERTFVDARAHCQAFGSDLVIPNTAGELVWLRDAHEAMRWGRAWLGVSDVAEEGTFVTIDGEPLAWSQWAAGEPNDWQGHAEGGGEDCAQLLANGLWNDMPCDQTMLPICEDRCPGGTDADGDGHDACGDDCNDGEPDVHAGLPEVCGDGLDNDCSGASGDVAGCGEACQPLDAFGFEALWCPIAVAWGDAGMFCASLGAELLWLEDEGEHDLLVAAVEGSEEAMVGLQVSGGAWIGLGDGAEEGVYVWTNGGSLGFEAWASGQPNNSGGGQDCVRLTPEMTWNDSVCETPRPFLCRQGP